MTEVQETRVRDPRLWIAVAVLGSGAAAWMAVAVASSRYLEYSSYLGVVGIGLALGCGEATYLLLKAWANGQRGPAIAGTSGAALGSALILAAIIGGVSFEGFVMVASGVGLIGFSSAIGIFGLIRARAASTAVRVTAFIIIALLAYFAQLLWAQVP